MVYRLRDHIYHRRKVETIDKQMKPQLVQKIEGKDRWHRVRYELKCVKCGNIYIRHSFGKNTSAYCEECTQRRNYEIQKQKQINKVLEQIKSEIEGDDVLYNDLITLHDNEGDYCAHASEYVLAIIDKYMKGEQNG